MAGLARVKREVRSLLLSLKEGCTPRRLQDDYLKIIGEPLPYEQLGFSSLMAFLESVPDVVHVLRRLRSGPQLYGVADESTRHIARLVKSQRTPSKGRGAPRPHLPTPLARHLPKAPPMDFEINLARLFLAFPDGIILPNFMEAYGRRFGRYPDFARWGFTSIEHLLRSLPHITVLRRNSSGSTYIAMPVAESPTTVAAHAAKGGVAALPTSRRQSAAERWRAEEESWGEEEDDGWFVTSGSRSDEKGATMTGGSKPATTAKTLPSDSLHSIELSPTRKSLVDKIQSSRFTSARAASCKRPSMPRKVVNQVEQLLRSCPVGIRVSKFQVEYKILFEEDLPVASLGYTSVVHMLSSLSVCEMERQVDMGDWVVYSKGGKRSTGTSSVASAVTEPVSDGLANTILLILKNHPDGVSVTRFPAVFKELTDSTLPVEELGFDSVTHLLGNVKGVRIATEPGGTVVRAYCRAAETNLEREESKEEEKRGEGSVGEVRSGAVKSKSKATRKFPVQKLPSDKMYPVYLSHVKTPSSLAFQLIGESTSKALESLQEDLAAFYNSKSGRDYILKDPSVGECCCTVFANDGYWYRAEITALPALDQAEVCYVDYGNVGQVPRGTLRRLRAHYAVLPAQALQGRLANIKPVGEQWCRGANQMLFHLTRDKPIYATITSTKGGILSVHLTDTTTEHDVHINDRLVGEGLAVFRPDTDEDQATFDLIQLETPPLEASGDALPEVRPPREPARTALEESLLDSPNPLLVAPLQPTVFGEPRILELAVLSQPGCQPGSLPPLVPLSSSTAPGSLPPPLIATASCVSPTEPPIPGLPSLSAPPTLQSVPPPPLTPSSELGELRELGEMGELAQYLQHIHALLEHRNPLLRQAASTLLHPSLIHPPPSPFLHSAGPPRDDAAVVPVGLTPPPTPTPTLPLTPSPEHPSTGASPELAVSSRLPTVSSRECSPGHSDAATSTPLGNEPSATPTCRTVSSATPTFQSVSSAIPTFQPISSATLTSQPVSSATPTSQPVSSATPTSQPVSSATPTSQPVSIAISTSQTVSSATPTSQTVSSTMLISQTIPSSDTSTCARPTSQTVSSTTPTSGSSSSRPLSYAAPVFEPSFSATPTSQPFSSTTPTFQPICNTTPTSQLLSSATITQPVFTATPSSQPIPIAAPTFQPASQATSNLSTPEQVHSTCTSQTVSVGPAPSSHHLVRAGGAPQPPPAPGRPHPPPPLPRPPSPQPVPAPHRAPAGRRHCGTGLSHCVTLASLQPTCATSQVVFSATPISQPTSATPTSQTVFNTTSTSRTVSSATPNSPSWSSVTPTSRSLSCTAPVFQPKFMAAPTVQLISSATPTSQTVSSTTPALRPIFRATPASQLVSSATPTSSSWCSVIPTSQPVSSAISTSQSTTTSRSLSYTAPVLQPKFRATHTIQLISSATPTSQTVSSTMPTSHPGSSATPTSRPVSSATPISQTVSSATPTSQPVSSSRSRPLSCAAPVFHPSSSAVPTSQPFSSAAPTSQPVFSSRPLSCDAPVFQPNSSATLTSQPFSSATASFQPVFNATPTSQLISSAMATCQSVFTATPSSQPIPIATPTFQPASQAASNLSTLEQVHSTCTSQIAYAAPEPEAGGTCSSSSSSTPFPHSLPSSQHSDDVSTDEGVTDTDFESDLMVKSVPAVIQQFGGTSELLDTVNKEIENWKSAGKRYFKESEVSMVKPEAELTGSEVEATPAVAEVEVTGSEVKTKSEENSQVKKRYVPPPPGFSHIVPAGPLRACTSVPIYRPLPLNSSGWPTRALHMPSAIHPLPSVFQHPFSPFFPRPILPQAPPLICTPPVFGCSPRPHPHSAPVHCHPRPHRRFVAPPPRAPPRFQSNPAYPLPPPPQSLFTAPLRPPLHPQTVHVCPHPPPQPHPSPVYPPPAQSSRPTHLPLQAQSPPLKPLQPYFPDDPPINTQFSSAPFLSPPHLSYADSVRKAIPPPRTRPRRHSIGNASPSPPQIPSPTLSSPLSPSPTHKGPVIGLGRGRLKSITAITGSDGESVRKWRLVSRQRRMRHASVGDVRA